MKNLRHTVAVIAGLLLAIGWFVFADSDRWNPGRVILGIGMSIAATITLIRQPMRMTRLVVVIIMLPLLATLVLIEAQRPSVGWPLALAWSMILLGVLFFHACLNRCQVGDAGIRETEGIQRKKQTPE